MAYCDKCGNFDDFLSFENKDENDTDYQAYNWSNPF